MAAQDVNNILNSIPGFAGYRDKERRRESDRRIREHLAREYGAQADRLGRMLTKLAEGRNLAAIGKVDGAHQRLVHFISRLTTASYGYAGLFSDRPVDERALDQIARFDQSLADDIKPLSNAISALESTPTDDPSYALKLEDVEQIIESLHDRFDRRGEIIESAEPAPEESVVALLKPATDRATKQPTAYRLHDGDALTYQGENYEIIGRITITGVDNGWRDFQLKGGAAAHWLRVPSTADGQFLWQTESTAGQDGDQEIAVDGVAYSLTQQSEGVSEVVTRSGETVDRTVTVRSYQSKSDDSVVHVYDWGTDQLALQGQMIEPVELQIWSKEGGQAI